MKRYFIDPRTRIKGYGFLLFPKNVSDKYGKQLLNTATKTGINASNKVIHRAAETTGELLGNKISDAVTKSYNEKFKKTKPVVAVIIPPENREQIFNKLRQVL